MKKDFNVIIEKDADGFFLASVPALKGCHTQAKSLDILMVRIKEAIELCLEVQSEQIYPVDFVGVQRVTINEKTHYYGAPNTDKTVPKKVSYKVIKGNLISQKSKSESSKQRAK